MKNSRRTWITFSKSEMRGIGVLLFLLSVFLFLPPIYKFLFPNPERDIAALLTIEHFTAEVVEKAGSGLSERNRTGAKGQSPRALFEFDPNVLDLAGWQRLGLSEKQALALRRYVEKGGRFRRAEDLKKMYTISPAFYRIIAPYIRIAAADTKKPQQAFVEKSSSFIVLDINTADSADLVGLRGIGPAFARRIIAYRERLGGFVSGEQLGEIYGMDSLRMVTLLEQVKLGPIRRSIEINSAGFDELKSHPYLKYHQINAILQYRKQHGPFNSVTDIEKVLVLPKETVRKLSPYLIF